MKGTPQKGNESINSFIGPPIRLKRVCSLDKIFQDIEKDKKKAEDRSKRKQRQKANEKQKIEMEKKKGGERLNTKIYFYFTMDDKVLAEERNNNRV